ncbi:MAG: histidinol-phosphatase [Oscillospiraceae bacterium]|nr:histidinol-phosphatase [Oscillospiraceae bacterium]
MNYNYHTHTFLCGHATGTPEEYILEAINGGIRYMGFSDHAPHTCKNGQEGGFRVPMAKAKDYVNDLNALRNKYADKIDIKIGFEMEYFPESFDEMLDTVKNFGAEYLILGEHFMHDELPDGVHATRGGDSVELLDEYVYCVTSAMKSGAFSYIAHPDMYKFTGDKSVFLNKMRDICKASAKYNVPLEINFLGIRDNRHYPDDGFLAVAGEEKCPMTFGFDAHDIKSACDLASYEKAMDKVQKYGINYIGKPTIIAL